MRLTPIDAVTVPFMGIVLMPTMFMKAVGTLAAKVTVDVRMPCETPTFALTAPSCMSGSIEVLALNRLIASLTPSAMDPPPGIDRDSAAAREPLEMDPSVAAIGGGQEFGMDLAGAAVIDRAADRDDQRHEHESEVNRDRAAPIATERGKAADEGRDHGKTFLGRARDDSHAALSEALK